MSKLASQLLSSEMVILKNLSINIFTVLLMLNVVSCTVKKKQEAVSIEPTIENKNPKDVDVKSATLQRVVPGLQGQKDYYVCDFVLSDTLAADIKLVAMVYNKYRGVVEQELIKGEKVTVQLKQDPTLINNLNRELQLFYVNGEEDKSLNIYNVQMKGDLFQP